MYFSKEVIILKDDAADRGTALRRLADGFLSQEAVRDSFPQAVLDREEKYPTGLGLGYIGVAIPHTDVEHVVTDQLGFMSLLQPVSFRQMGDESALVDVSLIIMLALTKTEDQIPMLQKLVELIQDQDSVRRLCDATDTEDIIAIFASAGLR